jgi:hypothetical protein
VLVDAHDPAQHRAERLPRQPDAEGLVDPQPLGVDAMNAQEEGEGDKQDNSEAPAYCVLRIA